MRFKLMFIFLNLTFSCALFGIDCNLIKHLDHPNLASNAKFWEEYTTLSSGNKLNDRSLTELFKKHDIHVKNPVSATVKAPTPPKDPLSYSTSRKADKEIAGLSPALKTNYSEFMTLMADRSGIQALYQNPGRWHMEKIKALKDSYSVRLNGGVRVLFKLEKDEIHILEVNAAKIHSI